MWKEDLHSVSILTLQLSLAEFELDSHIVPLLFIIVDFSTSLGIEVIPHLLGNQVSVHHSNAYLPGSTPKAFFSIPEISHLVLRRNCTVTRSLDSKWVLLVKNVRSSASAGPHFASAYSFLACLPFPDRRMSLTADCTKLARCRQKKADRFIPIDNLYYIVLMQYRLQVQS